jgi:dipeptidyl aminopeptidase/acylaminoacyl peptidase
MRVCACVVLVSVISAPAVAQDPGQSAASVQEFLRKGGEYWSAPAKARSILGSVSGGDRFWIWPTEDRVLELRRQAPTITLAWRLNPQQRPIDQTEAQNLRLRFYSATGNFFTGASASTFAKELHGIESGAAGGTFEIPLGANAGEGNVLVFLEDGKAHRIEPLSNLLRITVKIVDGESNYVPPTAAAKTDGWSTERLTTRSRSISDFLFSPDGKMLASAGSDGAILLWDLGSGLSTLLASDAHRGSPHVEFSTDGGTLASWSQSDQRVKVWDVKTRRPLGEIPVGSGRDVGAVVFVPNSTMIAVLTWKLKRPIPGFSERTASAILFWNVAKRESMGTIEAASDPAFSPDGRVMATWSGKAVMLWDVGTLAPRGAALTDHPGVIGALRFSPDGKQLAVLDRAIPPTLTRWNVEDGTRISQAALPKGRELTFVNFSHDGRTLALGGDDKAVVVWDVSDHKPAGVPLAEHPDGAAKGVFSSDGLKLASGTARQIVIWELLSGRVLARCLTDGPSLPPNQWIIGISVDGRSVGVARQDSGTVTVCRGPADQRQQP